MGTVFQSDTNTHLGLFHPTTNHHTRLFPVKHYLDGHGIPLSDSISLFLIPACFLTFLVVASQIASSMMAATLMRDSRTSGLRFATFDFDLRLRQHR